MPPSRRTTRRQRIGANLTEGIRQLLEKNWDLYWRIEQRSLLGTPTEDEIRPLWRLHGSVILADWIAEHPGTRPYYWWTFDAPEKRRCLGGHHWFDDPEWQAAVAEAHAQYPDIYGVPGGYFGLSYGIPRLWSRELASDNAGDDFESIPGYLDRLGLWLPGERERWAMLPPDDDDNE